MKKKFLILPVLAALFAACTSDELVVNDKQTQQTEEDAIAFDAYLTRSVTRAGAPGNMTLESAASGDVKLKDEGFGVFAYYANGDLYSENAIPDFMYNQMVNYEGGWKYSPIKYWPNEFGSSAISIGVDRVTFFAYAPYVTVDPSTGQLTSAYTGDATELGITALTRNGKTGDPYVRYVAAFDPTKCVDLCYGVAAADYTSYVGAADGANSVKKGDPYINIAKPALDDNSKIYFDFKHALAQLDVQIDADVDIAGHSETETEVDPLTRIWVRSITFDGIAQRGYLNLNSGMWYDVIDNTKISHASVTVYDGRRDGAEAIADDSYETPIGFNPNLIQSVAYTTHTTPLNGLSVYDNITAPTTGVKRDLQNLFAGNGNLLVIPANEQLKVTIVYDVETADATLSSYLSDGVTKGKSVENKITKSITLNGGPLKLESGKRYDLKLHLGMNSVKFNATVSDWQDADGAEEYLPYNLPVYTAATSSPAWDQTITLPASTTSYQFAVNGFTGNEAVTATPTGVVTGVTVDNSAANSGGVAIVTATIDDNNTVKDVTTDNAITVTGSSSEKKLVVQLVQKAAPLGLFVAPAAQKISGTKNIVLSANATVDWSTDVTTPDNTDGSSIFVYKNGTKLSYNGSTPVAGEFGWSDGTITLGENATAGDVFTITVKASDAAAETYSFTVKKQDASISGFALTGTQEVGQSLDVTEPTSSPDASSDPGYRVTYTSSDPEVADYNSTTGKIDCLKAGTCTITATVSDTKNYHFTTPSLTQDVTVTEP